MSTFNGFVSEFPDVAIDYFRISDRQRPPLACFLSHVHSDHLTGLASLRSPFVYCSSATREILLRLEKYHTRLNFAKGILECHEWSYRRLSPILKPLPLETPTVIELAPGNSIRVTLFDANHCTGAVMFLMEGSGKAILYTGDIRAETWWVNGLVQNPSLIQYTLPGKTLDCIYLDTTFATKSKPYRAFPSKAAGLQELLQEVERYPKDTLFYFHSWTFGYENVWIALSSFLHTRIHLDRYRYKLYKSIAVKDSTVIAKEAPALCGFSFGNHYNPGCLTNEPNVRLHSCEQGMQCPIIEGNPNVVHIIPIISRANGSEIAELGAGGGKGDLDQVVELDRDTGDREGLGQLMQLCATKIQDPDLLCKVLRLLNSLVTDAEQRNLPSDIQARILQDVDAKGDDLPLQTLISILTQHVEVKETSARPELQSHRIVFPYSRHSSYEELCALVAAFGPKDVFPCTVDRETWTPEVSIRSLFGDLCSEDTFRHDEMMMEAYEERIERLNSSKRKSAELSLETVSSRDEESQTTEIPGLGGQGEGSERQSESTAFFTPNVMEETVWEQPPSSAALPSSNPALPTSASVNFARSVPQSLLPRSTAGMEPLVSEAVAEVEVNDGWKYHNTRETAYKAALGLGLSWAEYGGLVSARKGDEEKEVEL